MATSKPEVQVGAEELRARVEIVNQAYRDALRIFGFERFTYLVTILACLALLLYAAYELVIMRTGDRGMFGIVFGSSGAAGAMCLLSVRNLERAVRFVEHVIRHSLNMPAEPAPGRQT